MRKIIYILGLLCVLSLSAFAQSADGIKGNLAVGEVSAINTTENKISLKTKDGAIDAILSSKTVFKRIPPESPTLSAAVASTLADIGIGDKILVTGLVADDKKSLPAKAVYLMTKSDISKKQTTDQEKWKTRGISGKVKEINAQTKEITVTTPGFAGEKITTLIPNEKIIYRRYVETSNNFNDAKIGSFNEIKLGDQLSAVGNKSADGLKMNVEELISGSFRQVVGKITAIDVSRNEITIKDTTGKKSVTLVVVINENVPVRKIPAEMAMMMTMRTGSGGSAVPTGGTTRPSSPTIPPSGGQPSQPAGGQGGQQGRGFGGFDSMLERLPKISVADLKIGDTIGTITLSDAAQMRVVAINKVLSGVEVFLNAPQIGGGGGRGGQGGGSGFSIPGLDGGFGTP